MRRRWWANAGAGWIVGLLAAMACPSCGREGRPRPRLGPPEPRVARRAVEEALGGWRDGPPADRTTPTIRSVMFADQQRQPGQRLRDFAILSEAEMEGCRRFQVRLSLADPDETTLAAYYVFGEDPIWVYRAEDFDMIMHMDKTMMPAPPSADPEVRDQPSIPPR